MWKDLWEDQGLGAFEELQNRATVDGAEKPKGSIVCDSVEEVGENQIVHSFGDALQELGYYFKSNIVGNY